MNCHRCGKVCKNKTGLTLHYKKCLTTIKSKKGGAKANNPKIDKIIKVPKINKKSCIICKKIVIFDNGVKLTECKKYIHHGCLRLSRNIESLHCHSAFCKTEMFLK